jgi:putative endonuclease
MQAFHEHNESAKTAAIVAELLAGNHFLQKTTQYDDFICRFDVVGLESDLKCPKINWIKNAFEAL